MTNTNITKDSKIVPLRKGQSTYKMIIPEDVEKKIRYLLNKFPSTEWSGVLFCTHEGSFEDGSLTITCRDLFPMDLGDATFTSFSMDADVATYMAEHEDLFDCTLQLIHSHHSMSAFFSGTDLDTLRKEGSVCNCFVSLIVNNAGTYCAAVTRRMKTKAKTTVEYLDQSYEFFGEGTISSNKQPTIINTTEEEVIEYFMLDIEKQGGENELDYLDKRFDDIRKIKEEERKKAQITPKSYPYYQETSPVTVKPKQKEPKQTYLWDDNSYFDDGNIYIPNKEVIYAAVVRMLTCSLTVNVKNVDLKRWISKMDKTYPIIFKDEDCFFEWASFMAQFIITNFKDPDAPAYVDMSVWYYQSIVANAMSKELEPYIGKETYLDVYYDVLLEYMEFK